jgi:hypothetical protein
MKDLIIGAFENYGMINLKPWMNSIKKCGFTGDVLIITYGYNPVTEEYIKEISTEPNYIHIRGNPMKTVVCDRFLDSHYFLNKHPYYEYVFATDPADIVFQTNPSNFIRQKLKEENKIMCGSECVLYKDETWGNMNMMYSYPSHYEMMRDKMIYNAGSISGKRDILSRLFLDIFKLSMQSRIPNSDQAAFNILIQTEYKNDCYFSGIEDGYSTQCGTVAAPHRLAEYGDKLTEKPILKHGIAYNSKMEPTCILHQYNKVPGFYEQVIEKYKD